MRVRAQVWVRVQVLVQVRVQVLVQVPSGLWPRNMQIVSVGCKKCRKCRFFSLLVIVGYHLLPLFFHRYSPLSALGISNEVHELRTLVALGGSIAVGMNLLQQEGHIGSQGAHGLHTFCVELYLALACAIGNVPVL